MSAAVAIFSDTSLVPPFISTAVPGGAAQGAQGVRAAEQEQSRREDEELVARSQQGDAAAFDTLIIKYSPRLYALVYNMTSNHDDTNDLLQDIWAKSYRCIGGFRGKSQFYTWVHSIAANTTRCRMHSGQGSRPLANCR